MNASTLRVLLTAALTAHDRAFFQMRGLMNTPAAADMNTVRLNLDAALKELDA